MSPMVSVFGAAGGKGAWPRKLARRRTLWAGSAQAMRPFEVSRSAEHLLSLRRNARLLMVGVRACRFGLDLVAQY